jgi:hypothetical protein
MLSAEPPATYPLARSLRPSKGRDKPACANPFERHDQYARFGARTTGLLVSGDCGEDCVGSVAADTDGRWCRYLHGRICYRMRRCIGKVVAIPSRDGLWSRPMEWGEFIEDIRRLGYVAGECLEISLIPVAHDLLCTRDDIVLVIRRGRWCYNERDGAKENEVHRLPYVQTSILHRFHRSNSVLFYLLVFDCSPSSDLGTRRIVRSHASAMCVERHCTAA